LAFALQLWGIAEKHSSFCRFGSLVTGNLDWLADFQSLSAEVSGNFGQPAIGVSVFH
jgi:hypothetical protein